MESRGESSAFFSAKSHDDALTPIKTSSRQAQGQMKIATFAAFYSS